MEYELSALAQVSFTFYELSSVEVFLDSLDLLDIKCVMNDYYFLHLYNLRFRFLAAFR